MSTDLMYEFSTNYRNDPVLRIEVSVSVDGEFYPQTSQIEIPLHELAEQLKPFLFHFEDKG